MLVNIVCCWSEKLCVLTLINFKCNFFFINKETNHREEVRPTASKSRVYEQAQVWEGYDFWPGTVCAPTPPSTFPNAALLTLSVDLPMLGGCKLTKSTLKSLWCSAYSRCSKNTLLIAGASRVALNIGEVMNCSTHSTISC